jgi:surface polysaccharide O-acyltransferase-like enzyme
MVWLDNSRIIAIFAVVFLHVAAGVVIESVIGTESWWVGNLYDSLVRWCVPVFVMISGAVLLDPRKKEDLKTFYIKRLSKIFIPILFWSLFFLLWAMLKGFIKAEPLSLAYLVRKLISGKPHYHMWFLYMIIPLYLFTPFFRKILVNSTRSEITTLVIIAMFLSVLSGIGNKESPLFTNWFLSYIPFFFLGYLIRSDERNLSKLILWGVFIVSFTLTAVGCYVVASRKGLDAGLYFYNYTGITVVPMSVSVMYLLKSWTLPIGNVALTRKLSLLTLGVYLIHPVILETIQYLGYGPFIFYPAISIPLIAIVVFCLSLIGAWLIYKTPYLSHVI